MTERKTERKMERKGEQDKDREGNEQERLRVIKVHKEYHNNNTRSKT